MFKPRLLTQGVLTCWLSATVLSASAQTAPEAIRPDVLRPLQMVQELNRQNKPTQALALFAEIDALPAANPLEVFTTERLRAVVHLAAGQPAAAAQSLTKALLTERGTVPERLALMENLALIQYNAKAYADAALWAGRYLDLGGQRDQFRQLQAQALYLSGQYRPAAELLQQRMQREVQSQRAPDEVELRMLANAYQQTKDEAGYVRTLETLVRYYPKPEIWADLLLRLMQRPDMPPYLEIDGFRLMQQVGAVLQMADALDYAQLAITGGYPAEARQVLESAQRAALPATAEQGRKLQALLAEAVRLKAEDDKLQAQTEAQLTKARDGNPWVNMGLNLAIGGQAQRGAALMAQGLDKGGLRQPQAARLRLAYAHHLAGQREQALAQWQSLTGSSPEAVLARLWQVHLATTKQP